MPASVSQVMDNWTQYLQQMKVIVNTQQSGLSSSDRNIDNNVFIRCDNIRNDSLCHTHFVTVILSLHPTK